MRRGEMQLAVAITVIVAGILSWWALKQGAYFGSVFLPGAIIIYGLLGMLLMTAPMRSRLGGPALIAFAALTALALWILLSFAWTDSRDSAIQYAQHAFLYAALFGLGWWAANLAGARALIPLGAVAGAGVLVGVVSTIVLASGNDIPTYLHVDATLRYPIGYRNAEAAFLMISLFPLIAIASEGGLPWWLRALLIGGATMLLDLTVLAESRGSLPAATVALITFLALSPRRLRAATYLLLAALPVLVALPTLLDLFQNGYGGDDASVLPLIRNSARAVALSSAGSVVLAAICIRGIEMRLELGPKRVQQLSRIAAAIALVLVAVGGSLFVAKRGGPISFLDQRISEFKAGGNPNLQPEGTRFGVNLGTNRGDFWRVAWDQAKEDPLAGGGAGSFSAAYLIHRDSFETPKDPHSVEMLMLSELGIVGMTLFGALVVAATAGAFRSRRVGTTEAALVAGGLGGCAMWLAHSSYDWFWNYPAITAPAIFLLGAVVAPATFDAGARFAPRLRYGAAAVIALLVIAAVPLFLSQRYANRGYGEYPSDPSAALEDLDRAASLDPWAIGPVLSKGLIEQQLGRDAAAEHSFRDAIDREPDNYAGHYFLSRELAEAEPARARAEVNEAMQLNPFDFKTRALARQLGLKPKNFQAG